MDSGRTAHGRQHHQHFYESGADFTAVIAVLFLHETLHSYHFIGGGVTLLGVIIAQRLRTPLLTAAQFRQRKRRRRLSPRRCDFSPDAAGGRCVGEKLTRQGKITPRHPPRPRIFLCQDWYHSALLHFSGAPRILTRRFKDSAMQPLTGPGAPVAIAQLYGQPPRGGTPGEQPLSPAQRTTLERLVVRIMSLSALKAPELWAGLRHEVGVKTMPSYSRATFPPRKTS